jgi:proline dehydrogenase
MKKFTTTPLDVLVEDQALDPTLLELLRQLHAIVDMPMMQEYFTAVADPMAREIKPDPTLAQAWAVARGVSIGETVKTLENKLVEVKDQIQGVLSSFQSSTLDSEKEAVVDKTNSFLEEAYNTYTAAKVTATHTVLFMQTLVLLDQHLINKIIG